MLLCSKTSRNSNVYFPASLNLCSGSSLSLVLESSSTFRSGPECSFLVCTVLESCFSAAFKYTLNNHNYMIVLGRSDQVDEWSNQVVFTKWETGTFFIPELPSQNMVQGKTRANEKVVISKLFK